MTVQLPVGDVDRARHFYGDLFGGPPQFEAHEDFLEWRVGSRGETWVQVVGVPGPVRPLLTRMRFRVEDLAAARAAVLVAGIEASPITALPGVVRWLDFADPWGNQLGYYEDLAPSGQQPGPGGSVHDPDLFVTG
jgi:catechol 2,3-dioxygenase-like lactoylglutathione lyase family enzyme